MTHIHESRVLFSPQTIKKKKKTVVNLFVCAYFDFIWVYLN